MRVAIIGGGAAGFFAAISVKHHHSDAEVTIYEKTLKLLSKVRISGGGRCNLTNNCTQLSKLVEAYPRGGKSLKKAFGQFNTNNTIEWFETRGVPLVIQADGCVFPRSQDSLSIINCLLSETKRLNIGIEPGHKVVALIPKNDQISLLFSEEHNTHLSFDKVIVTTGGTPKLTSLQWLADLGHKIEKPIPSLFSFNMPNEAITQLMGVVVENCLIAIPGTKIKTNGALLITHWGMSGPAILKLSSYGARELANKNYNFTISINWANEPNTQLVEQHLYDLANQNSKKQLINIKPYALPTRLWAYMLSKSKLTENKLWGELGKRGINIMTNLLCNDHYLVSGQSKFKDEFVTCGGVSLQSIDMETMQSKAVSNLYFAGEIMDIDAITGGFNLQAAWATGYIAGKLS